MKIYTRHSLYFYILLMKNFSCCFNIQEEDRLPTFYGNWYPSNSGYHICQYGPASQLSDSQFVSRHCADDYDPVKDRILGKDNVTYHRLFRQFAEEKDFNKEVQCDLTTVENGEMTLVRKYTSTKKKYIEVKKPVVGTMAVLHCNHGYIPVNQTVTARCVVRENRPELDVQLYCIKNVTMETESVNLSAATGEVKDEVTRTPTVIGGIIGGVIGCVICVVILLVPVVVYCRNKHKKTEKLRQPVEDEEQNEEAGRLIAAHPEIPAHPESDPESDQEPPSSFTGVSGVEPVEPSGVEPVEPSGVEPPSSVTSGPQPSGVEPPPSGVEPSGVEPPSSVASGPQSSGVELPPPVTSTSGGTKIPVESEFAGFSRSVEGHESDDNTIPKTYEGHDNTIPKTYEGHESDDNTIPKTYEGHESDDNRVNSPPSQPRQDEGQDSDSFSLLDSKPSDLCAGLKLEEPELGAAGENRPGGNNTAADTGFGELTTRDYHYKDAAQSVPEMVKMRIPSTPLTSENGQS